MDSTAKANKAYPIAADIQWTTDPPTQPGTYWMKTDAAAWAVMVDIRDTDGVLTVWSPPSPDRPVASIKASWHGPIPPSTGSGSR